MQEGAKKSLLGVKYKIKGLFIQEVIFKGARTDETICSEHETKTLGSYYRFWSSVFKNTFE